MKRLQSSAGRWYTVVGFSAALVNFLKKTANSQSAEVYKGTVTGLKTSWQGKKFDASNSTGVNIINNKPVYPFKTYTDKGVQDKNLNVLKIDYNIPGNPFWLRFILDEIVETKTNQYLGKVHLNLIPGFPFSLGYFRLEK